MTIVFISGCTLGTIPFNVIQLLWMNLIMDILAAISLGTEPITETESVKTQKRIKRNARIFTDSMWRNIVVQSVYQVIVVLVLMYCGTVMFFDESYNIITTPLRLTNEEGLGKPTDLMKNNTIIFTTYFIMNMFNQINSRIVDEVEFNMVRNLFNNWIFWLVLIGEIIVTHLMLWFGTTDFGNKVLGVTELSMVQYIICWVLGALSLPLFIVTKKFIPLGPFQNVMQKLDLEREPPGAEYMENMKKRMAESVHVVSEVDSPDKMESALQSENQSYGDEDDENNLPQTNAQLI